MSARCVEERKVNGKGGKENGERREILALPILNKRYSRMYLLARTCAAYVSRIT